MNKHFNVYTEVELDETISLLNAFYTKINYQISISKCAEMMDTHHHLKQRNPHEIKNYILNHRNKAFVFIICLN